MGKRREKAASPRRDGGWASTMTRCIVVAAAAAMAASWASRSGGRAVVVAAYLPEYRADFALENEALLQGLDRLMLFSVGVDADGGLVHDPGFARARLGGVAAAARAAGTAQVLVTVGGGGRSGGFEGLVGGKGAPV